LQVLGVKPFGKPNTYCLLFLRRVHYLGTSLEVPSLGLASFFDQLVLRHVIVLNPSPWYSPLTSGIEMAFPKTTGKNSK
jgi:hypothetical protein